MTGYIIEHIESGKFVGKKGSTYAISSDGDITLKKISGPLYSADVAWAVPKSSYTRWLASHWFVEDKSRAKFFYGHTGIRRALALGRLIKEEGLSFTAYRALGTDGTVTPLMDIILNTEKGE